MKEKLIEIPIFNARVIVYYGEHTDVEQGINDKYLDIEFTNTIFDYGHYICVNSGENIDMCIMLYPCSDNEHIYHESLHAAYDILEHLGIIINAENHEILAFLMGYIAREITRELKTMKDER